MGEYAIRKIDMKEIKIGTCENMYYIRYSDRGKVTQIKGSIDPLQELNLYWRLPFSDEDNILPGDYKNHARGLRLWSSEKGNFIFPDAIDHPGIIQLDHESGLLLNVKCYHGEKLLTKTEEITPSWNGKSWSWELCSLQNTEKELLPIIHCRFCRTKWSCNWSEIIEYIPENMIKRFKEFGYISDIKI